MHAATILLASATAARSLPSLFPSMARLTMQQRAELVQLHMQDLSINAIVRRTGHDHKTVLRWARRFVADASLQDRAHTGRPVSRMTPSMVYSIRRLVKGKRGQSTRRTAATIRARGTPISHCTGVLSSLMTLHHLPSPKHLYSAMATSSGGCVSLLSRRSVIGDAAYLLMRRNSCVFRVLTVATT